MIIIITAFSWLCAGCTVHYFWSCFRKPDAIPKYDKRSKKKFLNNAWVIIYYVSIFIGVNYCLARGAETTIQWIPRNWFNYTDNGDPIWEGYFIAGFVGLVGSMFLCVEMERVAQLLRDKERDEERNRRR